MLLAPLFLSMLAFTATLECKFCDAHAASSTSALRGHLHRHHDREYAANLSIDSADYYSRYVPPTSDMNYCSSCKLYLAPSTSLPSHQNTRYHRFCIEETAEHSPASAQSDHLNISMLESSSGENEGESSDSFRGGNEDQAGNLDAPEDHEEGCDDGTGNIEIVELAAGESACLEPSIEADWMGRDCLEFTKHELIGEVFNTPLNTRDWQSKTGLREASKDFDSYARYRIVDVSGEV